MPIGRETETLEPIDQVVGKQDQMEICLIGSQLSGWDFAQGIGFEKFSNNKLPCCSLVVESPEIQRLQRKVCNNHLVGISRHLEEGELPGGFFWKETSYNNESLRCFPSPGLVFEFRDPEPRRDFLVMEPSKEVLDRFGDASDNGIKGWNSLKKFDNRMIVEGRSASHTNLSNSRRKL